MIRRIKMERDRFRLIVLAYVQRWSLIRSPKRRPVSPMYSLLPLNSINNIIAWISLQGLAKNPNIAVLCGDKDSTVMILTKEVYIDKLENMIGQGILEGKYEPTTDKHWQIWNLFRIFCTGIIKFHKNSSTTLNYDEVRPVSNEPAQR